MGLVLPTRIRTVPLGHLIRAMNVLADEEEKRCPRPRKKMAQGHEHT